MLRQHEIWKLVQTKHVLGGWLHQVNNSALLCCVLVVFTGWKILRVNHSITLWSHICTFQPSPKRSLVVGRNFSHVMVTSSQHARLRLRQVRLVTSTTNYLGLLASDRKCCVKYPLCLKCFIQIMKVSMPVTSGCLLQVSLLMLDIYCPPLLNALYQELPSKARVTLI